GAPGGTPIHASGSGIVAYAGWKSGYGWTVILDHGSGLATLYAHCSSLIVNTGETVSRGQVIARVGSTGLSTGNHLHFEVRINGEPVDPVPYIGGN
ncbi:MAG TPA: M23 family metallopeptidase, partial [Firmicutes bacterium]|nr:M23 family metallopeptidase [Bacillota bacterium]